jgi:hydrogenase maturation protease
MARITIIGYGSTLRGDDGVGQYVAHALMEAPIGADVDIITRHQLTPELVLAVAQADYVIFIDACEGETPGEVTLKTIEPDSTSGSFSHQVTPMSLLAAAQNLYGKLPQAYLLSIAGTNFDYGEVLSPQVEAAVANATALVQAVVDNIYVLSS